MLSCIDEKDEFLDCIIADITILKQRIVLRIKESSYMVTGTNNLIVTLSCKNQPGIVHAITGALLKVGADISESQQFDSPNSGTFFMRVQFATDSTVEKTQEAIADVVEQFNMDARVDDTAAKTRTLIMVSKD